MITAVHALLYSKDPDGLRAFLRDVLKMPSLDAGGGWPIFKSPPTELAVHPTGDEPFHELYLMCDDVHATVAELETHGVTITMPIADRGWGLVTRLRIPGGDEIGLYQPKHPTAYDLDK